jgi:hypothetical protein
VLTQIENPKSKIQNPPDTRHLAPGTSLPRFVVTLNASQESAGLIRVPLAITGRWVRGATTFAITRADLESIVRNFRERQNGEINVDYDHASEMPEVAAGGPVPSAGRIVRLDAPEAQRGQDFGLRGSGPESRVPEPEARIVLHGWYEPTPRARELLENREYRFISPAIEWGAKSKRTGKAQGTTLTSVALTNRPFLEELPQIRLSDPAFVPVEDPAQAQVSSGSRPSAVGSRQSRDGIRNSGLGFRVPNPEPRIPYPAELQSGELGHSKGGSMKHVNLSVVDGRIHITHEDLQDEFYFEAEDLQSAGAIHEAPLPPRRAGAAALSESSVVSYAQARALLSEAEAREKFIPAAEVFRAHAEQELEDAIRAGKILPRQRDDWRKIALSDLPTFRKLMGAQKPVVPLAPVGLAGTPPSDVQEQVKFLAEQRMRERQVSFGQALSEIGREQPDLVQQYRRAVSSHE